MIGTQVGKYKITQRLGRGSMGTVYRAVDETLHRDVAIKVLNAELTDPEARRRFKAEAVAIARLNHPGIAKIFELFEHGDQWLMAIEFVQGETLEQLVTRSGPMPVDRAVELVSQVLDALDHAHRMSVVHRDLKPANLMVTGQHLKVTDFGIARVAGSEHLTSAGLRMGTPGYMAPEQVMGEETDARADIFATGCVLFYLVSASLPYVGDTPLAQAQARLSNTATSLLTLRADLPPWLDQVLARALEREPARRFQTAIEFREALWRGKEGLDLGFVHTPEVPASLMETALPGSMPVAPAAAPVDTGDVTRLVRTPEAAVAGGQAGATSAAAPSQVLQPPQASQTTGVQTSGAARGVNRNALVALIAVVAIGGTILWVTSGSNGTAPVTPTPAVTEPAVAGTPVATETPVPTGTAVAGGTPVATATPVTTGTPVATATPVAGGTGVTGTPAAGTAGAAGATGAAGARGARGPANEAPISFDLKAFEVNGRRAEEVDAALTLTGSPATGTISVSFKRANPLVQTWSYKALSLATFARERNPRWSPALHSPPADLDLGGGIIGRLRGPRNWLVLQGQAWHVILALPDERVDDILNTLQQRSRVKIDRPAPAK